MQADDNRERKSPPFAFFKISLAAAQTAHLVLPDTQANASQNQKSRFLQRLIMIIQDEVLCYHSNISKPNRLAH